MDYNMNLKEISKQAKVIEDELGLNIDDILNKLIQEFGEFNDAVQKYRGRYCRNKGTKKRIIEELGDLLFNLSSVCNHLEIDPNDFTKFAQATLTKFEVRKDDYK